MKLKRFTKPRFLLVYPMVALLFLTARTTEWGFRLGMVVVWLGELVRFWANGYVGHVKVNWTQQWRGDAKIGRLITAGPYAYVRHPLYLGTFLIGAGFCLVVGNPWFALSAAALFLVVYHRKMVEEERSLLHEGEDAYARYHAAVPRWLPTGRRYDRRTGQ